jgi:hypothetical protein
MKRLLDIEQKIRVMSCFQKMASEFILSKFDIHIQMIFNLSHSFFLLFDYLLYGKFDNTMAKGKRTNNDLCNRTEKAAVKTSIIFIGWPWVQDL